MPSWSPPTGLVVRLPTQDLAATRDFYGRDLGLPVVAEGANRLIVTVGAAVVEFRQRDVALDDGRGLRLLLTCPDVGAMLQHLRALSIEVDAPPLRGATTGPRFDVRDPDGRRLTFVAERQ